MPTSDFTIWEVAADWHELMIPQPQHVMLPSIARCSESEKHDA